MRPFSRSDSYDRHSHPSFPRSDSYQDMALAISPSPASGAASTAAGTPTSRPFQDDYRCCSSDSYQDMALAISPKLQQGAASADAGAPHLALFEMWVPGTTVARPDFRGILGKPSGSRWTLK
jgi:hypothetical protein